MPEPKPGTTIGRITALERDMREIRAVMDIALDDLRVALERIRQLEDSAPEGPELAI